ncbi:hypothetical protein IK146_02195 [Candidatus Saccharibacteria bacterium]|nr:hypothetical protein [Candidatus Saccharibacteria bacterium]
MAANEMMACDIDVFKDPTISDYDLEWLYGVYEKNQKSLYTVNGDDVRQFDAFGTRLL